MKTEKMNDPQWKIIEKYLTAPNRKRLTAFDFSRRDEKVQTSELPDPFRQVSVQRSIILSGTRGTL